ncbi:MAG TPA: sensor histidine kinase, partial [Gammaproteobacteria bacterium]|nr:sensor histidine kinase [Gammaproteobacteria bacterium]
DHGEGIPEKHLSQITEPFYRADSSRQRNTGGFGLGLYLCRLIAEAHGGS